MKNVIRVVFSKLDLGKRAGKVAQQVKCLLHNGFNSPEPNERWRERTNSSKLSSDPYKHTKAMCPMYISPTESNQ